MLSDSITYTVLDDAGQVSNEAQVSLSLASELPGTGLVLRLEGDTGVVQENGIVTGWLDQSGLGNDLGYTGDPQLVLNELGSPSGASGWCRRSSGEVGQCGGYAAGCR